jgi:DNA-binding transcriptional ArsR family regulator
MKGKEKEVKEPNRALALVAAPETRAADFIKATIAPQRRRILRTLHEVGEARSPNELAVASGVPIGRVSYHVKVLESCGAVALTDTQQRRGAVEHFYASTVKDNELIVGLLKATKEDDETDDE